MDNADQELERGDEPVRHPVLRQSAGGRTQLKLTYTDRLELPKPMTHEDINNRIWREQNNARNGLGCIAFAFVLLVVVVMVAVIGFGMMIM